MIKSRIEQKPGKVNRQQYPTELISVLPPTWEALKQCAMLTAPKSAKPAVCAGALAWGVAGNPISHSGQLRAISTRIPLPGVRALVALQAHESLRRYLGNARKYCWRSFRVTDSD